MSEKVTLMDTICPLPYFIISFNRSAFEHPDASGGRSRVLLGMFTPQQEERYRGLKVGKCQGRKSAINLRPYTLYHFTFDLNLSLDF
jgi:hypothetical protein